MNLYGYLYYICMILHVFVYIYIYYICCIFLYFITGCVLVCMFICISICYFYINIYYYYFGLDLISPNPDYPNLNLPNS